MIIIADKKLPEWDDGRTIADMYVDGMPYVPKNYKKQKRHKEVEQGIKELNMTRKERWALIKAAYAQILPVAGIIFAVFTVILILMRIFWLN